MTPKSANGRGGKYYYYTCTRQNHFGTMTDCKAPMIPAESLEEAVLERINRIGVNVGDRQKIVEAAMREIDDDGRKLASKLDTARHRLTRVQAEIQNLLEVLKRMGNSGIASVGNELEKLEAERENLQQEIKVVSDQEAPLQRISKASREFIENWNDIGQLLAEANPDEKRCILHHLIQSLELKFVDTEEKRAEYALKLFPEVGPENFQPQNENETVPDYDNGLDVLTPETLVRHKGKKAPRQGLEP